MSTDQSAVAIVRLDGRRRYRSLSRSLSRSYLTVHFLEGLLATFARIGYAHARAAPSPDASGKIGADQPITDANHIIGGGVRGGEGEGGLQTLRKSAPGGCETIERGARSCRVSGRSSLHRLPCLLSRDGPLFGEPSRQAARRLANRSTWHLMT